MVISPALFRRLCRARAILTAEGDSTPTVAQVARAVGVSPYHLIRSFRALFGATPHQLRTQARLARARELLRAGESVTGACLDVGFASPASFSHLFGRVVGVTPSAYKRHPPPERPAPGCLTLMALLPERSRNFRQAATSGR